MGKAEVDNGPNLRAHRVLHRFTEQLDAEVQGAVDAARSRQLAPFESVQRRCEYLLARYVEPVQGRALPKHLLRKPAGLTVGADLVAGLDAVEPHLLDACLRQIQAAIETLRPFDGKPFGRKPVGRGSDRIDARNTRADEEKGAGAAGAGRGRDRPAIPRLGQEPRRAVGRDREAIGETS